MSLFSVSPCASSSGSASATARVMNYARSSHGVMMMSSWQQQRQSRARLSSVCSCSTASFSSRSFSVKDQRRRGTSGISSSSSRGRLRNPSSLREESKAILPLSSNTVITNGNVSYRYKKKNGRVNSQSESYSHLGSQSFNKGNTYGCRSARSSCSSSSSSVAASAASPSLSSPSSEGDCKSKDKNSKDDNSRVASVRRVTKETSVAITFNVDGTGIGSSETGIPFLDHMMDQIASHGLFNLSVLADGDTHIDDHHTNEDIALALGKCISDALGERKGIRRFGQCTAPLDEALVEVVLDLSGRPHLGYDLSFSTLTVGKYDVQLVEHFFQSLANTSGMTLHIRMLRGSNSHHIIEATFKAFARALRMATEYDPRRSKNDVPSSKGVLTQK